MVTPSDNRKFGGVLNDRDWSSRSLFKSEVCNQSSADVPAPNRMRAAVPQSRE